jgi:CheY-like chemotaxis protein
MHVQRTESSQFILNPYGVTHVFLQQHVDHADMASILVLEGDPDVRRLLLIVLAQLEHTATALDAHDEVPAGADLLLLDPVSPKHLERARRIRAEAPALPVICTSFLGKDGSLGDGPLFHLQKPFATEDLGAAIEHALG